MGGAPVMVMNQKVRFQTLASRAVATARLSRAQSGDASDAGDAAQTEHALPPPLQRQQLLLLRYLQRPPVLLLLVVVRARGC
jgi:hypothetical protein